MKRTAAICLVLVFICVGTVNAQDDTICRFIQDGLSLFGQTEAEMIAGLGQPEKTDTQKLASMWYEGEFDVVTTLWYPGLYLETLYLYQQEYSCEYPLMVDVTDPSIEMTRGLGVGVSREQVWDVLGEPMMVSPEVGYWMYECEAEDVYFYFSGDTVNRIAFHGYFP